MYILYTHIIISSMSNQSLKHVKLIIHSKEKFCFLFMLKRIINHIFVTCELA
jgi:hypothetical protein